ncbi:hypothetical protein BD324DRAFT_673725 [Kockovaella imperatae]|uniref:FAD/NAD(P)-binding domain-containing protein n=1 Tax=Kockovaella imperatae TaxID=4999 RepID=A0A1Y1UHP2_9TREE|nr:hypothetical protein BD324DRAFT_673725 [Kockovaella imperatae]ORX37006.1 hypothetical protein BD324DRAFT_673725 [Kockovaella imperatae]
METSKERTIVVLGASYGGFRAAQILAESLPPEWTLIVLERNSHMNHVYVFPRCALMAEYAPRAFIPYDNLFPALSPERCRAVLIHATVLGMTSHSVRFQRHGASETEKMDFTYAIYALGSGMPGPVNIWTSDHGLGNGSTGTKRHGITWMEQQSQMFVNARDVLIVGGGALGIQFATDLKELFPHKDVTLLHSRYRLLPKYPVAVHDMCVKRMADMGILTVFGQRVHTWPVNKPGRKKVQTETGAVYEADIVLCCTGQKPQIAILAAMSPLSINQETGRIAVLPTLQLASPRGQLLSHIFAVGDCADTGAIQAGNTAYRQAEVAAKNILGLVKGLQTGDVPELQNYHPGKPMIKLSLGIKTLMNATGEKIEVTENGKEDLDALSMW